MVQIHHSQQSPQQAVAAVDATATTVQRVVLVAVVVLLVMVRLAHQVKAMLVAMVELLGIILVAAVVVLAVLAVMRLVRQTKAMVVLAVQVQHQALLEHRSLVAAVAEDAQGKTVDSAEQQQVAAVRAHEPSTATLVRAQQILVVAVAADCSTIMPSIVQVEQAARAW
jgi:lysylphosphatidylglycerol synthetase-like protein (DUF2156 family)